MDAWEVALLFDYYGGMLTDKQKEYLDMRYNQDMSLSEIAEELGISRQGVHDNLNRTEALLRNMEAKTGCVRRYLQSRDAMQSILKTADTLRAHADPVVRAAAAEIVKAASSIEE